VTWSHPLSSGEGGTLQTLLQQGFAFIYQITKSHQISIESHAAEQFYSVEKIIAT